MQTAADTSQNSGVFQKLNRVNLNYSYTKRYQKTLDDLTPHTKYRWIGTGILGVLYVIRALTANGWYVVTVRI